MDITYSVIPAVAAYRRGEEHGLAVMVASVGLYFPEEEKRGYGDVLRFLALYALKYGPGITFLEDELAIERRQERRELPFERRRTLSAAAPVLIEPVSPGTREEVLNYINLPSAQAPREAMEA